MVNIAGRRGVEPLIGPLTLCLYLDALVVPLADSAYEFAEPFVTGNGQELGLVAIPMSIVR